MVTGIYSIRCLVSGKCYIGSSKDIKKRWTVHRHLLRSAKRSHHSQALQRAWDKYGEERFVFEVLEECLQEHLAEREQFWMKKLGALGPRGYNCCPEAGNVRGYKMSPAAVEKMRQAALKRAQDPAEKEKRSHRAKVQHKAGRLGRSTWTEESKARKASPEFIAKGAATLRAHIAAQTPEEMARRARLRKTINGRQVRN